MKFDLDNTLYWTRQFIALLLIQQSFEMVCILRLIGADGIWQWKILDREFKIFSRPVQSLLRMFLAPPRFFYLVVLQLFLSVILMAINNISLPLAMPNLPSNLTATILPLTLFMLFLSASMIAIRFRGTFNGGSDYMTLIILSALLVAAAWPALAEPALIYVAVQTCLSYFVAGIVKIKEARWRNGYMLRDFIIHTNYSVPERVITLFKRASRLELMIYTWPILLFECGFPVAFLNLKICYFFLAIGLCFHLANVYVFGLNRFFFAWLSAYPAVAHLAVFVMARH